MYIWNVPGGTKVTQQMMANLYGEASNNPFGFSSYISEGFEVSVPNLGLTIGISPGTAQAVYNQNFTSILSNIPGFYPTARTRDTFNGVNSTVFIDIPPNSSGYIVLEISLTSSQAGLSQYTTSNNIVFSYALPSPVPPSPPLDGGSPVVGRVVLYKIISNSSSITYCSNLGPSRDVNLKNYYGSLNLNLLNTQYVPAGLKYPTDGLVIYPNTYLPSYCCAFLGSDGVVSSFPMNSTGIGSATLTSLAVVKITDEIRVTYPQFYSTGIYLTGSLSQVGFAGIFIPDSMTFDLSIKNPFTNPVTTDGCYFISQYTSSSLENSSSGILICSSQATSGYHGLVFSYNGSLMDVVL